MLPDDMKFIDDFLFYEVKADGKDEIIRKVEKIDVKDKDCLLYTSGKLWHMYLSQKT